MQEAHGLASLPHAEQLALLDARLASGHDPGALLDACAALPDHNPLAHLLRTLHRQRRLLDPPVLGAFLRVLAEAPETAVQQALGALPAPIPEELARQAARACLELPLGRLPVLALLLRWLGRVAPGGRAALRDEATARVRDAVARGAPEQIADAWLVLAPLAALREDPGEAPLQAALSGLASRVIDTLAAAPRTLSQANAEELLARRVYEQRHHFFFELLQNADDARATGAAFSLVPTEHGVELWLRHDGVPFDARDVLGLLSIGQSTKEATDIGLFGVGFKSVAAVSERPRLYSGPYAFEIAALSRPRRVAPLEPPPGDDTLLALPLRPEIEPGALVEEAARIPPEVLLTLRHLRALSTPGRAVSLGVEGRIATLRSGDQERRYLTAREPSAPLLAAILLGDDGLPAPLPPFAPTLYCFLPTREETGLPLLIHARFDVPLDRERLRQESPRNAGLLREAGALLARLLGELHREGAHDQVEALLALLADARPRPFFSAVLDEARRGVRGLPLLPGADGVPLAPEAARRVPAPLARALAGLDLDREGRRALAPLSAPLQRAVAWLGVPALTPEELLALLEKWLEGAHEGDSRDTPLLAATAPLAEELARLPAPLAPRLAALPWITVAGRLYRASSVRLATGAQAALYGALRPLRIEDREASEAWGRVGLRWLSDREILDDLRDEALRGALLRQGGVEPWLAYLAGLGPTLLAGVGALPIFPDGVGNLRPLLGVDPSWLWPRPPLGAWLAGLAAPPPSLLRRALQEAHEPLLRALGGQVFGVELLGGWLQRRPEPLAPDEARALVELIEAHWRGFTPRELDALLRAPIFLDAHGQLRPLRGEGRALLPEDDALPGLAPQLPWLHPSLRGGSLAAGAALPALGPASVLTSLLGEGPLFERWPDLGPVLDYLEPRAAALPRSLCERLARAPCWPGEDGSRWPLPDLSKPTRNEALERFYRSLGLRPRVTADGARLAALLGVDDRLATGDFEGLFRDLRAGLVDAAGHRHELIALLREGKEELPPKMLARLAELPLFLASDGRLRPLAPWSVQSSAGPCYRAGSPWRAVLELGSRPLLAPDEEERWGPLLDGTGCPPAEASDWLASLERDATLRSPEALRLARATLRLPAVGEALAAVRSRLARLPLWRDRGGSWAEAGRLVHPAALAQLLGEPWEPLLPEATALLHPDDLDDADGLASLFSFRAPLALLDEEIRRSARPGVPLSRQPPLLGSLPRLGKLHALAAEHAADRWPLGVDGEGNLSAETLLAVTEDEAVLLQGTPLLRKIALPAWSAEVGGLEPLPASRLLAALRERCAPDSPALLPEHRALLLAWIERRGDEIARDTQARGLLGKLPVFPTRDGSLRTPCELLLTPELAELDLPGRPADELGPGLLALLSRLFRLDDGSLDGLVAALLEASLQATDADDRAKLEQLNRALASVLVPRPGAPPEQEASVERVIRRHRLARRLRVVNGEGPPVKARQVLLCSPEHHRLIQRFHTGCPPRYEGPEELAPLLRRLGAVGWLEAEELAPLLRPEGRAEGFDAALALALYLAEAATETPSLRARLDLDRARWVPARDGSLHPPSALFWPEPALASYLEDRPGVAVHPLFARSVPPSLGRWFSFRRAKDIPAAPTSPPPVTPPPAPPPASPPPVTSPEPPRSFWQRWFAPAKDAKTETTTSTSTSTTTSTATATATATRTGRTREERWFRPQEAVSPQLGRTEGWMESRRQRPRLGFAHTPGKLPAPYTYAPSLLAVRFDPETQRWERGETPGAWLRSRGRGVGGVVFRGEAPEGEVVLPRPLYGEVVSVRGARGELSFSWTADGLVLALVPEPQEVTFEVELREAPGWQDAPLDLPEGAGGLLERTTLDGELPRELAGWLEELLAADLSPLARALRVRDFIRARYRYDPSYLEDEGVARWLRRSAEGSRNLHLAALHAGRGGKHLGAGVCYELNGLCCELLRRAGIPAAVSVGWVLSGEQVDEPDHLWAMALLPTAQGPRWLPLDASTTREGTPLRVPRRPAGAFRRPAAQGTRLPPAPAWAAEQPAAGGAGGLPVAELARVLRYAARQAGEEVGDEGTLRREARALLEDPERARELLKWLRRPP